ncbi:MAG TPA: PQQ-binding-like beta-propeller repeat protein [Verrucomicrobiota bacterium]|nr:PQQ-binding-like beta-propeller repeat protein [Verrucomicrobiota bacterium]
MKSFLIPGFLGLLCACGSLSPRVHASSVNGWLAWRGPEQTGVSRETGLPDRIDPKNPLWRVEFPGASTPVIANGRLYIMGYLGEGADLQEGVACFDAETGKKLWQHLYNDFLSDTIYLRYATASPAIDPETGNVFIQGTQGILAGFTPDGKLLWKKSLMEEFGRLTFPNARTASPVIEGDLVITRGITANWGAQGPAGDRFYAFDKKTGELVWSSSPSDRPRDNSFSHPYITTRDGKRVLYAALGDGSVAAINARTGEPIWRVPLFRAGINATVLVHNNDKVIAIFGVPYEPGQLVALKIPDVIPGTNAGPVVIPRKDVELWAAEISTSTSSPILVGDMIYVVAEKGDLCAVNANTGETKWKLKLGIEQRNSCPLFADGKLYVPMLDNPAGKGSGEGSEAGTAGAFYIIKPGDQPEMLQHAELEGRCFGTPVAYNGKLYMQTTKYLYCWGNKGDNPGLKPAAVAEDLPKPGVAKSLQIIPSEATLRPGQSASFRARKLDPNGFVVEQIADVKTLRWTNYIPPTARVRSTMKASFNADGQLVAANETSPSAGAFEATLGDLKGYIRGRALPYLPLNEDFESFALSEMNTNESAAFAYPPLPWIGARFKFEIRERDGTKCLTKTIDNKFFQRATVFLGSSTAKNYTIEADVMSDGNRRKMSEVGVVCQRYAIVLKGNEQKLEVNSNLERLRESVDFKWSPNEWYRLKARVDVAPDGTGVVRAKAWKRGDPEPDAWTIEVKHNTAHQEGSPGLFGFSPQDMRVYIDNIKVTAN